MAYSVFKKKSHIYLCEKILKRYFEVKKTNCRRVYRLYITYSIEVCVCSYLYISAREKKPGNILANL